MQTYMWRDAARRVGVSRSFRPPHQDQWRQGGEEVLEGDDDLAATVGYHDHLPTFHLQNGYPLVMTNIAMENHHF